VRAKGGGKSQSVCRAWMTSCRTCPAFGIVICWDPRTIPSGGRRQSGRSTFARCRGWDSIRSAWESLHGLALSLRKGSLIFAEFAGVHAEAMLDLFEYNAQNGFLDSKHQAEIRFQLVGSDTIYHPRTIVESHVFTRCGRMQGLPAVTQHAYGQGHVYYIGVGRG